MTGPLVGGPAERIGKFSVFAGAVKVSTGVIVYTRLGSTQLLVVFTINALLFVAIAAHMVPAQALISAVPAAAARCAFMAINVSSNQAGGGVAEIVSGLIGQLGLTADSFTSTI